MSVYLDQIRQLVALQHVDDHIHDVKKSMRLAPAEVEELTVQYKQKETQRDIIIDKLQHMNEQQRRLKMELEDENSRMKKSKSKLMQVSNTKEYQAIAREMDTMERNARSHSEESSALLVEITYQEELFKEVETVWNSLKIDLEVKRTSLEARLVTAQEELKSLEGLRKKTGADVPAPILSRYEFIRRRLEHPVIVSVTSGVCSGCSITMPPQTFIELQRGQQIWSCPACQRLIYWTEHFEDIELKKLSETKKKKVQVFAEDASLEE